ncbi:MAG: glycosyltransferase [Planctomycetota bacterium]
MAESGQSNIADDRHRPNLLTFAVEEYFQADPFPRLLGDRHARRLPHRLAPQTDRLLRLLDAHGVTATFFVLGKLLETHAEVIRRIADAGHELAARNHQPESLDQLGSKRFTAEADEVRDRLEQLTGLPVRGFRIARGRFGVGDAWAMDALADAGFRYDSSVYPRGRELRRHPDRRFPFVHESPAGSKLFELPMSTWGPDGWLVPLAGGTTARQLPGQALDRVVRGWSARYTSPFVLYFHLWEFDAELPRMGIADRWTRLRRYRNLHRTEPTLRRLLERHRFMCVRDFLADDTKVLPTIRADAVAPAQIRIKQAVAEGAKDLEPFTAVIPCFNEQDALPYTAATLEEVRAVLSPRDVQFVFVDDRSTDNTWEILQRDFAIRADTRVVRHGHNRGVAAAILTGIGVAETPLVGSMDCDCTYDPTYFAELLPLLKPGVAMVTASPYHPGGTVRNVPAWRLCLSRGLSWMYRRLLKSKLHTYTSCFRIYRRKHVADLKLRHGGFLGMAEMIVWLDQRGAIVLEHPATLESRLLGTSKMKTCQTIRAHLGLLAQVFLNRQGERATTQASA